MIRESDVPSQNDIEKASNILNEDLYHNEELL